MQKAEANRFFGSAQYSEAIGEYDKALASCPNYLEYEVAVLKSNIAACHLKLEDWKSAIESATAALDALDRLSPKSPEKDAKNEDDGAVVEIEGDDEAAEEELARLQVSDQRRDDIQRIRAKAQMRRAKARTEDGGWANLQGAEEGTCRNSPTSPRANFADRTTTDYKALSQMPALPPQDKKIVQKALATLPPRINEAKEKEMGEMMGKLKELGNGILKPFGLSTDMFNMVKDEKTGGYSMNFNQGN